MNFISLIGNGTILPSKIVSSLFPEKKLLENNEKVFLLNKVKEKKKIKIINSVIRFNTWNEYSLC